MQQNTTKNISKNIFKSWKFYYTYIIHITSIFKHSYFSLEKKYYNYDRNYNANRHYLYYIIVRGKVSRKCIVEAIL